MTGQGGTRIALIGAGAMGGVLLDLIQAHLPDTPVVAVLARGARGAALQARGLPVVADVGELLAAAPDVVVECAGHGALAAVGVPVLRAGVSLMVASVGALADAELERSLGEAARAGAGRLLLPSGALGGLDALASARYAGLSEVTYISSKAPAAWRGTPAEDLVDLARVSQAAIFFRGSAREAALRFPQNANVAAAVGLAGLGLDHTEVALTVDPLASGNRHRILARGDFGFMDVTVQGKVLPANPKTSMLAPMSLIKALVQREAAITLV